jgi:hypothetical protein
LSLSFSSSTLAPEIREMYPGTRGSTHGDKNETIPARNTAIGRGNEDINLSLAYIKKDAPHCNLVTDFLIAQNRYLGVRRRQIHISKQKNPAIRRKWLSCKG